MAESSSNEDIFDPQKIRHLVELMKEYDLGEIDLRQGDTRVQIRRGAEPAMIGVARPGGVPPPLPAAPAEPAKADPAAAAESVKEEQLALIRSPMVGTFYSAPDPESSPFVEVGDYVGPQTAVCVVEAMKVFNEIPAEVSGRIVAVLVENGDPVEYGQPMFKVDRRQ